MDSYKEKCGEEVSGILGAAVPAKWTGLRNIFTQMPCLFER